jgi:hypothetical protein
MAPFFRPKANRTCHQKPNPSREIVPLKNGRCCRRGGGGGGGGADEPLRAAAGRNLRADGGGSSHRQAGPADAGKAWSIVLDPVRP